MEFAIDQILLMQDTILVVSAPQGLTISEIVSRDSSREIYQVLFILLLTTEQLQISISPYDGNINCVRQFPISPLDGNCSVGLTQLITSWTN